MENGKENTTIYIHFKLYLKLIKARYAVERHIAYVNMSYETLLQTGTTTRKYLAHKIKINQRCT